MRPNWPEYFINIAHAVAARADCTRRQVGCVIVDPTTHDIIQTGYNGTVPGAQGCLAGGCPRGLHHRVEDAGRSYLRMGQAVFYKCACGSPWPCTDSVAPGSSYDTGPGACISVHAEANTLIRAGKLARGTYMYCTDEPCGGCRKLIAGAGVKLVQWGPLLWWDVVENARYHG